MQAAEVLGIAAEDVHPTVADTDSVGFTAVTGGSRVTYATGMAAHDAAQDVVRQMKERAALLWGVEAETVTFSDGQFSSGNQSMTGGLPSGVPGRATPSRAATIGWTPASIQASVKGMTP